MTNSAKLQLIILKYYLAPSSISYIHLFRLPRLA